MFSGSYALDKVVGAVIIRIMIPMFDGRAICVEFMVDKVKLGCVFL
jgi:hypothetical protein